MCLIIYSPDAKLPPRNYFAEAAINNPDGIGVMSREGVVKFLGKRKARRAWRYVSQLAADAIPFGVHFRWATHGRVSRDNCHPFEIPGTGAYLMHNGILWTSLKATDEESDTAIFARTVAPDILAIADTPHYLQLMSKEASGNRLLIMRDGGATFDVVNRGLWTAIDGILYSNLYSFDPPQEYRLWGTKAFQGPGSSYAPGGERGSSLALPYYGSASNVDDMDAEEWLAANPESWEVWDTEYCRAVSMGYSHDDAEDLANGVIMRQIAAARDAERPGWEDDSAYYAAKRGGFDWHNPSTWDRYDTRRVLNRHGDNEEPCDLDAPSAADMFI